MTNADKFKSIFGLYATELWAKPEKDFLEWLNADNELFRNFEQPDVPDTNVGDMIDRQAAIDALGKDPMGGLNYESILGSLPSVQPEKRTETHAETHACDLISRQAVINELVRWGKIPGYNDGERSMMACVIRMLSSFPFAQPERLTDKEQRIFLAAMGREEKVCKEVDRNYVREPYEDSLMRVCKEIRRKVKGALWT